MSQSWHCARGARILAFAFLLLSSGCVGSGSEVGPKLPDLDENFRAGTVLDAAGNVVSGALVQLGDKSTLTDKRGRFQIPNVLSTSGIVRIDARRTTAAAAPGVFDEMSVSGTFFGEQGSFQTPLILPNFANGASAPISVNQGAALAGTLTDPATGAELVLDGAIATIPGSSDVNATIRFVSIPPEAVSAALDVAGLPRAGALYFAIAPARLQFSVPPTVRAPDTTFAIAAAVGNGKNPSPELDALGLDTGTWTLAGPVLLQGGFLTSSSVAAGGYYCISTALPAAGQTIITARAVDRDLDPLPRAVALARDGRSSRADDDGLLAIPGVVAADADGNAIPTSLTLLAPVFRAQQAVRKDTIPGNPGGGQVTDFGDRPIFTIPSARVRVLPVHRGDTLEGARVGVASAFEGTFNEWSIATSNGSQHYDVPVGQFAAAAGFVRDDEIGFRGVKTNKIDKAGSTIDTKVFLERAKLKSQKQKGEVRIQSMRANSGSLLFKAFSMVGIDPATALQGVGANSVVELHPLAKGFALTTTAHEFEVVGTGSGVDQFRKIAYETQYSDCLVRRPTLASDLDLMPPGFDPAAIVSGAATGLTNPAAPPPANGNYSVEVRARRSESFEGRVAIALGGQSEFLGFLPATAAAPTFANANYETLVPAGQCAVALVERDTAAPGSALGPITKIGFAAKLKTPFGKTLTEDIAMSAPAFAPFVTSVVGSAPPSFRLSLVLELEGGDGLDLGDQGSFTFNGGTGALDVSVVQGAATAAVLFATGTTPNQSAFFTSAASLTAEAQPARFLVIPEIAAPAPPPADVIALSPTGAGIAWAADPETDETVIKVTRAATGLDSAGKIVQTQQEWNLLLPGPVAFPFRFPVAPPNSQNTAIPSFFQAGAVYAMTIEVRKYQQYDQRAAATSPDLLRPENFLLRSVARTQFAFKVQ